MGNDFKNHAKRVRKISVFGQCWGRSCEERDSKNEHRVKARGYVCLVKSQTRMGLGYSNVRRHAWWDQ